MAKVANNDLTYGLRGRLGEHLVFRMLRGKTIVSRRAQKPDKTKETAKQRSTRDNFRRASAWAREQMRDPEQKAFYAQRARELDLPNAYTAAIKAYMSTHSAVEVAATVATAVSVQINYSYTNTTDTSRGPKVFSYALMVEESAHVYHTAETPARSIQKGSMITDEEFLRSHLHPADKTGFSDIAREKNSSLSDVRRNLLSKKVLQQIPLLPVLPVQQSVRLLVAGKPLLLAVPREFAAESVRNETKMHRQGHATRIRKV